MMNESDDGDAVRSNFLLLTGFAQPKKQWESELKDSHVITKTIFLAIPNMATLNI